MKRKRTNLSRLAAVFLVGATGAVLIAQAAQAPTTTQTPTFRGGVNFVSVDVYPRRDGRLIEGLTAGDFQVLEDGKPQKVETFEFVKIEPNPVDSDRRDPSSQAEMERLARDPRNRIFVVYLDLAHTTVPGSHAARQPVVDFLTRTIGQRDLFGFMTAEVPAGSVVFGRRTETIEAELAKYWTWGQAERIPLPRTPAEQRLMDCALMYEARTGQDLSGLLLMLSREDQLQTNLENLVLRLRDLRDERKNILFISEGWKPRGPRDDLANLSLSQGDVPPVGVGPGGRIGIGATQQPANQDMTDCTTRVRRLVTQDFEKRFRELLTSARNANVSFYPVDVGGLRTVSPVGGNRDTLLTLAENTDGFAVTNTNDLQSGVRKIAEDLSAFYLLGYYSTNAATDGRFRRIEVKVTGPRIDVSARRGYLAPTGTTAAATAATSTGPTPVDVALGRLGLLRDSTEVAAHGAVTSAGLQVVADLSASAVAKPTWQKGAEVKVTARRGDAPPITGAGGIAAGERSVAVTLPVEGSTSGPWQITLQVAGPEGLVEARTEVTASPATLIGEPTVWRGAQSLRAPFKPLADFRLTRTERLRVEYPELQVADTRTARLLDRKGAALGAQLPFATPPPDRKALVVDLPMSSLPEGDFVLEVTAVKGETTERRLVAFRVIR
jgi:VWFA-related protein